MSKKSGGPVAKLVEKNKRNAMNFRMGTNKPITSRSSSSYHEKAEAFKVHKERIHGFQHGRFINEGGYNPAPPVTYDKDGEHIVTFRGDGLPDDSLGGFKAPKTNAERAAEDKRAPIKSEVREGWKPQRYVTKWMRARGIC
jgi:hypothetical protein